MQSNEQPLKYTTCKKIKSRMRGASHLRLYYIETIWKKNILSDKQTEYVISNLKLTFSFPWMHCFLSPYIIFLNLLSSKQNRYFKNSAVS